MRSGVCARLCGPADGETGWEVDGGGLFGRDLGERLSPAVRLIGQDGGANGFGVGGLAQAREGRGWSWIGSWGFS